MPRRLRRLIDTAQNDMTNAGVTLENANKLIANADDTLKEIDDIMDAVGAQGYVEIQTDVIVSLLGGRLNLPIKGSVKIMFPIPPSGTI